MPLPTEAALWTDPHSRAWSTAISVNAIKRVKDLVGVNLMEAFEGDILDRLADDPELLVNTLFAVCKPQADERGISDEAFGELVVGDTIDAATAALVRGIVFFFPKTAREKIWRRAQRTNQIRQAKEALAVQKLDSPLLDQAITNAMQQASEEIDRRLQNFGDASGNSPESSASIQAP